MIVKLYFLYLCKLNSVGGDLFVSRTKNAFLDQCSKLIKKTNKPLLKTIRKAQSRDAFAY